MATSQDIFDFDNDIVNPEVYADEVRLHGLFASLRHSCPVRWSEPRDYAPFWAITKYDDIREIERQPALFINGVRNRIQTAVEEEKVRRTTGGRPLMRTIPTMDNPDHRKYRALTQPWFQPASLRRLEPQIAVLASEYVDRMRDAGGQCDFVKLVSVWFPLRVIMLILGVPPSDGEMLHRLTLQLFSPHDPDAARETDGHAVAEAGAEFFTYFRALLQERRNSPREDLATVIANARIDDQAINELDALAYCVSITAAGHETTAGAIAGGIHALSVHPAQYAKLRANLDLLGSGVEEILRWTSPVRSMMRTATQDYVLRSQRIEAGQSVLMLYPSANRDESVFGDPGTFDLERSPNPHVAFGFGNHICLGLLLARMEMLALLREIATRVEVLELASEPIWVQANFLGGVKRLSLRYRM